MRFAIVGAGLAGLHAAGLLEAAGHSTAIYEKARGAAGRLATRRGEAGSFDHGAQYFTARTDVFRRQVADWIERGIARPWQARLARVEDGHIARLDDGIERYVGTPGMSSLARDLRGSTSVEFGVRIESIRHVGGVHTLVSDCHFDYPDFDAVIVAVPPAQAVPLVRVSPLLSTGASGVSMLPCHAVMVGFEAALEVDFDAAFVASERISWVAHDGSKPSRTGDASWVIHSNPDWSHAHLELEAEEVARQLIEALEQALGQSLPGVEHSTTHRWLYARTSNPLDGHPLWDADRRIGLCGDWVQGDRVEDAYVSAERLVAEIAKWKG